MLRPCALAGFEDLLGITSFKGWVEDVGGGTVTACAEHWKCSYSLYNPSLHQSMSRSTHWCSVFSTELLSTCVWNLCVRGIVLLTVIVLLLAAGCCESILHVCSLAHWGPGYENGLWDVLCDELHTNERSHGQPGRMDNFLLWLWYQTKIKQCSSGIKKLKEELLGNSLQSETDLQYVFGK